MNQNIHLLISFSAYLLLLLSCNISHSFEREFKNHISGYDLKVSDGDPLHPTYAYLKNGNLRGIKSINHPSCGNYMRWYFISENQAIEKIIVRKDFYTGDCGKYDSLFVISPITKEILVYTKTTKGQKIQNEQLINAEMIDIESYVEKVKKWNSK